MAEPANTNSSLVVISYHPSDQYWSSQLVSLLNSPAGDYGIWIDRIDDERPGQIDGKTQEALKTAKVLVVLLSPRYLKSTWLGDKEDRRESPSPQVLSVIAQSISREQLLALPREWRLINSTPLTGAPIEVVTSILSQISDAVRSLTTPARTEARRRTTIADLSKSRSVEVENALHRARKLATLSSATPAVVTTPALLFALAEGGRDSAKYFRTPQFLRKELMASGEDNYTRTFIEEFPGLTRLGERAGRKIDSLSAETDLISPNVVNAFELAGELARYTVRQTPKTKAQQLVPEPPGPEIGARHLLAALLVYDPTGGPTGVQLRLRTMVKDLAALRKRFYNFIVKNLPDDDHVAWASILINLKVPPHQSSQLRQPASQPGEPLVQPSVAGFMADEWDGNDLLGITRDVNALASLIAAYKVEPPLSIGLFGDWGSGKSHFMRQMRRQVEKLSEHSRNSNIPQNELGYYKNIVQIEFNAWHYIEGNLWASLVDHIFANLKLSEKEPQKFAEQRRDELMQKLGLKEELAKKIDSQVEECETELRKVKEHKEQAEKELNKASTLLEDFRHKAVGSLETLTVAVDLTAEEKELLGRLGIEADGVINGAEVRKNYDELKGVWNRIRAQWKLFSSDKRVIRRYVLSALLVVFVVGGPLLLKLGTFPRLYTAVITILGMIATVVTAAKPAWDQFQKSLTALKKQDDEIERQRRQRVTQLESKVNVLAREVVETKLKSETVGKEIEELKADIASTSSGKLLAEFIEDRAAANDYRRHLGLLALIRRDFEKLRDLFNQQREEEIGGADPTNENRINRIVLYIDDLDRCPPDRVVQVLQAIHLLLAFPLFVVVVGVDSRWITRSLQQSYEWLREEEHSNGEKTPAENQDANRYGGIGATPHDYLEKIFQIPFWLRSMNDDACLDFISGLTKQSMTQSSVQTTTAKTVEPRSVQSGEIGEPDVVTNREVTMNVPNVGGIDSPQERAGPGKMVEPDQKLDQNEEQKPDLAPQSLTFSNHEVEYMKTLAPLIGRSPRAVKRFLNCYRLIKVGLSPAEFEKFVGEHGESESYKAAMILLGIITGAPAASSYLIEELKSWPKTRNKTVEDLATALETNRELLQQPDAQRLTRFLKTHNFGKPSDSLFRELMNFAPRASRFSFRMSRAEASEPSHPTAGTKVAQSNGSGKRTTKV